MKLLAVPTLSLLLRTLAVSLVLSLCAVVSQGVPVPAYSYTVPARLLSERTANFFSISSNGEVSANSEDESPSSDAWLQMHVSITFLDSVSMKTVVKFQSNNYPTLLLGVTEGNSTLQGMSEDGDTTRFVVMPSKLSQGSVILVLDSPDISCYLKYSSDEDHYICQLFVAGEVVEDSEDTWVTIFTDFY